MSKISLTIPEPCNQSWDSMKQEENGRFCASCKKVVVDFSSMSDAQIVAYFKTPKDSFCGRFDKEQLDRDIITAKKRLPLIRYFFGLAFPAFIFSLKASGQANRAFGKIKVSTEKRLATTIKLQNIAASVLKDFKGNVYNEKGEGIANVTLLVKGTTRGVVTDSTGFFALKEAGESIVLQFSSVGYEPVEQTIKNTEPVKINMKVNQQMLGEIIVSGYVAPRRKKTIPLLQRLMPDTLFKTFKVYPNPVRKGGGLMIENKRIEKGEYVMMISNSSGQTLQSQKWTIDGKKATLQTTVPATANGTCIISLKNTKTGVHHSENILVGE